MTAYYYPEHAAELMQAVYDFVRSQTTAAVIWAKQRTADGSAPPVPAKPFVRIDMLTPPIADGQAEHRNEQVIVIDVVAPETAYELTVNGTEIAYTSRTVDEEDEEDPPVTVAEIRAALISLVNDADLGVTAGAFFASNIFAIVKNHGEVVPVISDDGVNLKLKIVDLPLVDGIATFSVDAFTDDDSAPAIAKAIELGLDKRGALDTLNAADWSSVTVEGVRKPDQVVAANWESRAGFDMRLRCRMRAVELNDFIEEAIIDVGIQGSLSA